MQKSERQLTCFVARLPLQQHLFPNGCNSFVILHTDNLREHMPIMFPVLPKLSLRVLRQVDDIVRASVVIRMVIELGAWSGVGGPLVSLRDGDRGRGYVIVVVGDFDVGGGLAFSGGQGGVG